MYSRVSNCLFQKYKMNFDKNTGIIEMFMESLGKEDEGTYTFQLQDGKATNQSSLVLIGEGTHSLNPYPPPPLHFNIFSTLSYKANKQDSYSVFAVFKQLQKESEFQRKEWHRKQGKHSLEKEEKRIMWLSTGYEGFVCFFIQAIKNGQEYNLLQASQD